MWGDAPATVPDGVDADAFRSALASARALCGWHIAPQVTSHLTLDGDGSRLLLLPTLRLVSVESVKNDGATVTGFEQSTSGMLRLSGGCWSRKLGGIEVTFTHGFDELPADIAGVVLSAASRPVAEVQPVQQGVGPFTVSYGSWQAGGPTVFSYDQQAVLARYKIGQRP